MTKLRILLSVVAFLFGLGVLGVSLSSVSTVQSTTGQYTSTSKQLYFSDTILPDHIAYPVLMAMDRIRLETAPPLERVYLQTQYANRRLEYAQRLLEKDEHTLALTTLTKAQKYLLAAGHEAIDNQTSDSVKNHIIGTLEFHKDKVDQIKPAFTNDQRSTLDLLNQECLIMIDQLQTS